MPVLQFDPKQYNIVAGGNIIQGYTDGSFITITRAADMWALKVGCDGIGTRVKSNNRSGLITITLHQSSISNDALSALALADELTSTGVFPLSLRDASGRSVASCVSAWVVKYPDQEFSNEVTERAWDIASDNLAIFVGGN